MDEGKLEFKFRRLPSRTIHAKSLIYRWEVLDGDTVLYRYIGRAQRGAYRPLHEYRREVNGLLAGAGWRNASGRYREVHHRLAQAMRDGHEVTLLLICNVRRGQNAAEVEYAIQKEYGLPGRVPAPTEPI